MVNNKTINCICYEIIDLTLSILTMIVEIVISCGILILWSGLLAILLCTYMVAMPIIFFRNFATSNTEPRN